MLRGVLKRNGIWARIVASEEWEDVGMLDEHTDKGHALTKDEQMILLLECRASAARYLETFVILLIETGARYNTIRTLTWKQVSFAKKTITIGQDKTKTGTGRVVPLSPRACKTLRRWAGRFPERRSSHFVFCTESYAQVDDVGAVRVLDRDPNKPVGTIAKAWRSTRKRTQWRCPTCKRGKVAKHGAEYRCHLEWCGAMYPELPEGLLTFRVHDCRHSATDRMISSGVPLPVVAKVLGWAPSTMVAMSRRYSHPDEAAMRAAVGAISGKRTA